MIDKMEEPLIMYFTPDNKLVKNTVSFLIFSTVVKLQLSSNFKLGKINPKSYI